MVMFLSLMVIFLIFASDGLQPQVRLIDLHYKLNEVSRLGNPGSTHIGHISASDGL